MEEIKPIMDKPHNPENAIVISGATFAWDEEGSSQQDSSSDLLQQGDSQQQRKSSQQQQQQTGDGEAEILLDDNSLLINKLFDLDVVVKKVSTFFSFFEVLLWFQMCDALPVPQLNMISGNHHSSKFRGKWVYFLLSSWTAKSQKKGCSEHPSLRKGYFTELVDHPSRSVGQSASSGIH